MFGIFRDRTIHYFIMDGKFEKLIATAPMNDASSVPAIGSRIILINIYKREKRYKVKSVEWMYREHENVEAFYDRVWVRIILKPL